MYAQREREAMASNKVVFLVMIQLSVSIITASSQSVALPGCREKCGNLSIPYPFGVSEGCYLNHDFLITCNDTFDPPRPFLRQSGYEVLEISLSNGEMRFASPIVSSCSEEVNGSIWSYTGSLARGFSAFSLSTTYNRLIGVGCDTLATITSISASGIRSDDEPANGCLSTCRTLDSIDEGSCDGFGCCHTALPKNLSVFEVAVRTYKKSRSARKISPCSYAAVAEVSSFEFSKADLRSMMRRTSVPAVLDWAVWGQTCPTNMSTAAACKSSNSECYQPDNINGYRCRCKEGYDGNPYLLDGCQDIDECKYSNDCVYGATCINTNGSYTCSCPKGTVGDGLYTSNGTGCTLDPNARSDHLVVKILAPVGGGMGALLLLICGRWIYKIIKRRKKIKLKQKFFERNGGLLLKQQVSSSEGSVERIKVFNSKELEKATDNFNVNRILGQGGQGTVYKGMLINGKIVAVKKSKMPDDGNVKQFINEVIILSQINHRNVVSLMGCCLETEVPLLVYEFIPNGTLYQYLHDPNDGFPISWEVRLRIATEVAGALSYLHFAASIPIYHRDVKTSNILLDEKYCAKIADFGTSRTVSLDQTHVTTAVQGTFGYLDPQFLQSGQFTDKSDVYSFGVVLVELLTGQKPLSSTSTLEGRSLAMQFILSMKEDKLFSILDDPVSNQGRKEEIVGVANLAMRCLNLKGRKRPTMKEVATQLEAISKLRCPFGSSFDLRSGKGMDVEIERKDAISMDATEFRVEVDTISVTDEYSLLYSGTYSDSISSVRTH